MQYLGIPSIIIICYLIGEISKLLLRKKRNYKYIPIIVGISGGILGLISYYISPNIVLNVKEPIIAISLGIISGLASIGSHEVIVKLLSQIIKKQSNKKIQMNSYIH